MSGLNQRKTEDASSSKDEILNHLHDLLNSEDYKQLASVISDSVDKTLHYTRKGIKCGEYHAKKAMTAIKNQTGIFSSDFLKKENKQQLAPVAKTPAGTYSGPLIAALGITCLVLACINGSSAIIGGFQLFPLITFCIFLIFGSFLSIKAKNLMGQVTRFRKYLKHIDLTEPYIQIDELAYLCNKSRHFVQRDLSRMINKNMFQEGHLSDDGKYLLLTDQAYQNYLNELAIEKRKQEVLRKKIELEKENPIYKEIHRILDEGESLVQNIVHTYHLINDSYVKQKTEHLIVVIQKILSHIQEHPEDLSEIRRFMTYYLPTTEKIIKAYRELEMQPVQGSNIQNTKQEIKDSLDTIIQAFETLFDSLFKEKASDISSDLAVMRTMFSRESLTNIDEIQGQ